MAFVKSTTLIVLLSLALIVQSAVHSKHAKANKSQNHKRNASPEDIEIVQKTWPQINENAEANGVVILKKFLDKFNYYSMFKKFEGMPHDETIKDNKVFKIHARMIMANLNTAVMNAHTNKVAPLLKALGKAHSKRGVTKEHVDNLFSVIEDTIKEAFGFTPRQLTAWHNVLEQLSIYMKEGLSS